LELEASIANKNIYTLVALTILVLGTPRRNSMKHALNTQVFVNIRPMHTLAVADYLVVVSLLLAGIAKSPRPSQRDANDSPINKVERNEVVCD
jgi:hypothetical protein